MIDEQRTLEIYGYTSDELKPQSNKRVVAVCEGCGKYRDLAKQMYRELCNICSKRRGENHPDFIHPPNKNELEKLYLDKRITPMNISKIYGVSEPTVYKWIREYCIPIRNNSEAQTGLHGGEKNINWKGGITKWRVAFYKSAAYMNWRTAIFKRDGYTCQECGDATGGNLQAHHIEPIRDHKNDLSLLDINNGITLCKTCHAPLSGHEYSFIDHFAAMIRGINNDLLTE